MKKSGKEKLRDARRASIKAYSIKRLEELLSKIKNDDN